MYNSAAINFVEAVESSQLAATPIPTSPIAAVGAEELVAPDVQGLNVFIWH